MATAVFTTANTAIRRWRLPPAVYRLTLMVHVLSSVAWIGAEAVLLTLAVIGINTGNPQTVRAVYVAMGLFGPWFYIPLAFIALASGLVLSLGTKWGPLTYSWVTVKLVFNIALAVGGTLFVMAMVRDAASTASMAPGGAATAEMIGGRRFSLVGAFSVGMGLLLAATVLSYYKPWGRIPWPWCRP